MDYINCISKLLCLVNAIMLTQAQLQCQRTKTSEYGQMLALSSYKTYTTADLGACYRECLEDGPRCCSINYSGQTCSRNYVTKKEFPERFVKDDQTIYAEAREPELGSSSHTPALSCKRLLEVMPLVTSGTYWISPKYNKSRLDPFQVFCDMETHGGGWTLVYNYHFTDFGNFDANSNAVTPIPTWPFTIPASVVPQSKTAPLNESFYSAMEYDLWKVVGSEFLYKSTITHWAACTAGTGDLLRWKPGTLNCKNIKNVSPKCLGSAPSSFSLTLTCGPALYVNGDLSVYFEGYLGNCFPLHDPCGVRSSSNYLTTATNPGGSVYVR